MKNIFDNAWVFGNARVSDNAEVCSDAKVSGNAWVSGDAWVFGNARVFGNADIESNNDWFSFIYGGTTLTGYRSRNEIGYELNIGGNNIAIEDLKYGFDVVVRNLIAKFTPLENKARTELQSVLRDLEKQLNEAKNRLKEI